MLAAEVVLGEVVVVTLVGQVMPDWNCPPTQADQGYMVHLLVSEQLALALMLALALVLEMLAVALALELALEVLVEPEVTPWGCDF